MVSDFAESYLGRLRAIVGSRRLLVPSAGAVVEDDRGRVLLGLRSDFRIWGLPGGMADEGEDIVTCILRETLEETGLRLADPIPFGFASSPETESWTYPNGDICHCFTMLFTTRSFSGEPAGDGDETLRLDWFEPDALPEVLPTTTLAIAAFLRWKETGTFQMIR